MFDDLRAAFYEALENFNRELRRENVSDTADRLLLGMKREITDEKADLTRLQADIEKAREDSTRERELALTCRRRERLAREIGDEETASVAAQHAVKHEGHHSLLEKKALAMQEELDFRRRNVDDMIDKFTKARQQRDSLTATAGRAGAHQSFTAAQDLFDELDRMAEKIEGDEGRTDAADTVEALDFGEIGDTDYGVGEEPAQAIDGVDLDAALAELKRRMGEG